MGQPQQITLVDPDCEVKLSTGEIAVLIGSLEDTIDATKEFMKDILPQDEVDELASEVTALKALRQKLVSALERG